MPVPPRRLERTVGTQKLTIDNGRGHRLAALLDLPDGPTRAYVVLAHCFTCSKNLRAASRISRALTDEGYAVLRFDFTGLGQSEGDFVDTTFTSNVDDLVAAAEYLGEHHRAPALLVGHSLGGAAVLLAAARLPSVRAVVTLGAPADPAHVTRLLAPARETIEREGEATVVLAGREFRISRQFLEDIEGKAMEATIAGLRRALLVLHAPGDDTVGIENASRIFTAARHPKSFISLDDADHLLSRDEDALFAGSIIAAWARRYVGEDDDREEPDAAATPYPVVARIGQTGYRTEITAGGHALVADEPRSVGGTDTGPSPYELLLAGLGACTAMTLRMYADRKGIPLTGLEVHLEHKRSHAVDSETGAKTRLDHIHRFLTFEGEIDETQRVRMTEIADRCPVHRTLTGELCIETLDRLEDPHAGRDGS